MKDPMDFYVGKLAPYAGWTVSGPIRTPKHLTQDEARFGLALTSPDGKRKVALWILQDDEDNGSGSFNIEEIK